MQMSTVIFPFAIYIYIFFFKVVSHELDHHVYNDCTFPSCSTVPLLCVLLVTVTYPVAALPNRSKKNNRCVIRLNMNCRTNILANVTFFTSRRASPARSKMFSPECITEP
ncbi:hypothetical protein FKM82_005086 [Ascaphus truei]